MTSTLTLKKIFDEFTKKNIECLKYFVFQLKFVINLRVKHKIKIKNFHLQVLVIEFLPKAPLTLPD